MTTPGFEGSELPPNAVLVHEYTVGYGNVTGMSEDGVTTHPLIAVIVNQPLDGPLLILEPLAAAQLCIDVVRTLPEVGMSGAERKRMQEVLSPYRARPPLDLFLAVAYLFSAALLIFLSVLFHHTDHLIDGLAYAFAPAGLVAITTTLLIYGTRWREKRRTS